MARATSINQVALKIARVVHEFARARKWKQEDYHLFMTYRDDIFFMRLLLVAKELDGRGERQKSKDFNDLWDAINDGAKSELEAINFLRLVLRGTDEFNSMPPSRLRPEEIEIDEKLINNGVSWSESPGALAH